MGKVVRMELVVGLDFLRRGLGPGGGMKADMSERRKSLLVWVGHRARPASLPAVTVS